MAAVVASLAVIWLLREHDLDPQAVTSAQLSTPETRCVRKSTIKSSFFAESCWTCLTSQRTK